jgi:hypothetical protein
MDEYNSGMDPEVKKYFRQIMNSFSVGLLWLMVVMAMGLFFRLGIIGTSLRWYNVVFYCFFVVSLAGLIYFFYRVWKKK